MRQWDTYCYLLSAYGCPLGDMGPADNQTSDGAGAFPSSTVILSASEGSRYKTLVALLLLNTGRREDEEMVNGEW